MPIPLAMDYGMVAEALGTAAVPLGTMTLLARGSSPLESCGFERVSRRYEVAEARADRASCGFLIKLPGSAFC